MTDHTVVLVAVMLMSKTVPGRRGTETRATRTAGAARMALKETLGMSTRRLVLT